MARKLLGIVPLSIALTLFASSAALAHERTSPLPGGKYVGETALGKRVVAKVRPDAPAGTYKGVLRLGCADVVGRLNVSGDGHFTAQKKGAGGEVIFNATGKFTRLTYAEGTIDTLAGASGNCAPATFRADIVDPPVQAQTATYGPFEVPADSMQTFTRFNLAKPCTGCYIVGVEPDLVYNDGTRATHDTGAHLHHVVFFNNSRTDATCAGWPERLFASGDERTPFAFPKGYGFPVNSGDDWWLLTDLMNMRTDAAQELNIQIRVYSLPAPAAVEAVRPFWLDIDNCNDSEYTIPAGFSDTHRDFTVPAALAGDVVVMGGHLHNDGVRILTTNETAGGTLCTSTASYGSHGGELNLDGMSTCAGDPLTHISAGDVLRLHSEYDSPTVQTDVMGIMLGAVVPDAP